MEINMVMRLDMSSMFRKMIESNIPKMKGNGKSKIIYSSNSMKSRKIRNDTVANRDEWANRSGIYHNMSEYQIDTLERIINHLEKMVGDDL
jgi:hypothetical protein